MNINFSVSQFNRATRANGETIIEVSNDDISPCIVTIITDQRTNSPLIVLSNINDANLHPRGERLVYSWYPSKILRPLRDGGISLELKSGICRRYSVNLIAAAWSTPNFVGLTTGCCRRAGVPKALPSAS